MRSTTTTTGATTWRVGPSGMAPLPGWRRVLPGVTGGPCTGSGSRAPAGVVVGNRPLAGARWRDRRSAPQRGFVRESVRNVWPAGCWGSSPGRLYLFSPLPAPLPWSVSFPRRFREARWDRRPEGGGSSVPAGTAKGSGSRDCASRPRRTEAIQPPPPHRRKVSPWICSRCSVPWTRTSIDLARARAAFVAGHGPQVVAERRRPGTGCRTGRDRRRAPGAAASVSASGDGLRIHARRAPGPTPGGTPPVRAGIVNRARTRPWQVDSRCSGTGPWPDGVAGQAPLAP